MLGSIYSAFWRFEKPLKFCTLKRLSFFRSRDAWQTVFCCPERTGLRVPFSGLKWLGGPSNLCLLPLAFEKRPGSLQSRHCRSRHSFSLLDSFLILQVDVVSCPEVAGRRSFCLPFSVQDPDPCCCSEFDQQYSATILPLRPHSKHTHCDAPRSLLLCCDVPQKAMLSSDGLDQAGRRLNECRHETLQSI
jgi:hypothetical protein